MGPMSPNDFNQFKEQLPIKQKTRITQPERLSTMEDFCSHQHIFFTEKDRVDYSVKRSKYMFNDFKDTLNKGFKKFKFVDENEGLNKLLNDNDSSQQTQRANKRFLNLPIEEESGLTSRVAQ